MSSVTLENDIQKLVLAADLRVTPFECSTAQESKSTLDAPLLHGPGTGLGKESNLSQSELHFRVKNSYIG